MRRDLLVSVLLASTVSFLLGAMFTGGSAPVETVRDAVAQPALAATRTSVRPPPPIATGVVNFADVAERVNPAVVNIDAASRGSRDNRRRRDETDSSRD